MNQWQQKKAGKSMAISIAMVMQRYDVGHITRWSTFRASLEATGCCHRLSACAVSPQQPPWSKNSNQTHKTLTKHNFQLATTVHFDRKSCCFWEFNPKSDPLLSSLSLMRWVLSCICETLWLELESSAKFLAIKSCQRTKIGKVIKLAWSSLFKWAHIWANRG